MLYKGGEGSQMVEEVPYHRTVLVTVLIVCLVVVLTSY